MNEPVTPEVPKSEDLNSAKVNEIVHSAISARMKRFDSLEQKLTALLDSAPAPKAETPATETDPMAAKIAQLETQLKKEQSLRQAKERETRETQAYALLRDRLAPSLRPDALETASKYLFHTQLKITEAGPAWSNGYDLDQGLSDWLTSKEAQLFLPAPKASPVAGSGFGLPSRVASTPENPMAGALDFLNRLDR